MKFDLLSRVRACCVILAVVVFTDASVFSAAAREFPLGSVRNVSDLPTGRFRSRIEQLPAPARARAMTWLGNFHFTDIDLESLHADNDGGIYYACAVDVTALDSASTNTTDPVVAAAAVPVSPFPAGLVFHSRPGAPNVLFLNFCGETVTNTSWNTSLGRTTIPAVAFSTDGDYSTFSDSEQATIKKVWQRVSEDYAPFNIDVTTERPASFNSQTAEALITSSYDATGNPNPSSSAGGVSYVGVFGSASYGTYRPAWIYFNNLANDDSYIGEATAHEVGHNLGLSHDAQIGTSYYSGHGSGDISWSPIMGVGYNRNVTQWSKGEYYLANNTEDDLAIISSKVSYRADDHGNTIATADALMISSEGIITSTTPDDDPINLNPSNKGVIERNTDVDVFSFATGTGPFNITVYPWVNPAGLSRGGDLDVELDLYDSSGNLLMTNNQPDVTYASIQANLTEGVYYVAVRNCGTGAPFSSSPTGYTPYGSLGQYFISGTVVPSSFVIPPTAAIQISDITFPTSASNQFTVTYADNVGIAVPTIDGNDIRVTGPNGYDSAAQFVSVNVSSSGTPRVATYAINPPADGSWTETANGTYTLWMQTNQVADTEGAFVSAGQLGQFNVSIAHLIYSADMNEDPGWTFEGQWQYGTPAYLGVGPINGFTGTNIVGYNLGENYPNNLITQYATTPVINCAGSTSLTLHFYRWLRLKNGDTAVIQVSTNGTAWTDVWSAAQSVSDTSWQEVQYSLPDWAVGSSTVQLRWGMGSGQSQNDIGWNMDDVELLGGGSFDTTPPSASVNVADLLIGGSSNSTFTVSYSDDSAVQVNSLSISNLLLVTGPNGYTNFVTFVSVDIPTDGTPRTATYSIPAPGGIWDSADNGIYQIVLWGGKASDIFNNRMNSTALGSFTAAILDVPQVMLSVSVNDSVKGTVSTTGGMYPMGSPVQITATPADYYKFTMWTGTYNVTNNPLDVILNSNTVIEAVFTEIITTNHATPYWWLAANGYTQNLETVETTIGANGYSLWESYIAGLNPSDPESQLKLQITPPANGTDWVLTWNAVAGRIYTVYQSTNLQDGFTPMTGAAGLPSEIESVTNSAPSPSAMFFRLGVELP